MDDLEQVRMIGGMAGYELAIRATEMVNRASNEKTSAAKIEENLRKLIHEVFADILRPHLSLITSKELRRVLANETTFTFNRVFPRLSRQDDPRIVAASGVPRAKVAVAD